LNQFNNPSNFFDFCQSFNKTFSNQINTFGFLSEKFLNYTYIIIEEAKESLSSLLKSLDKINEASSVFGFGFAQQIGEQFISDFSKILSQFKQTTITIQEIETVLKKQAFLTAKTCLCYFYKI
jgi:hypothetical protein